MNETIRYHVQDETFLFKKLKSYRGSIIDKNKMLKNFLFFLKKSFTGQLIFADLLPSYLGFGGKTLKNF